VESAGVLLGDHRFAHVIALLGAAFFLGYARPSPTSKLAATLLALFPSSPLMLLMSWTEPIPIFFLTASLFCAFRAPRWLFLALGGLFAPNSTPFFCCRFYRC
jgi:hypothetical protein